MAGTFTPDPSLGNVEQHRRLYEIARHYCEVNFDPDADLVGTPCANPPNKRHHGTGGSVSYAYGLLLTGDPADRALAQKILKQRRLLPRTQSRAARRAVPLAGTWRTSSRRTSIQPLSSARGSRAFSTSIGSIPVSIPLSGARWKTRSASQSRESCAAMSIQAIPISP